MVELISTKKTKEDIKNDDIISSLRIVIEIPVHSPDQVKGIKQIHEYDEDFIKQISSNIFDINIYNSFQIIKVKFDHAMDVCNAVRKMKQIINYFKKVGAGFSCKRGIHFKLYNTDLPIGGEEMNEKERIFWLNLKNKIVQYEEIIYRITSRTPVENKYFIHRYNDEENMMCRLIEDCNMTDLFEKRNAGIRRNQNSDVEFRGIDISFETERIEALICVAIHLYTYCMLHYTHDRKRTSLPYSYKALRQSDPNLKEKYSYERQYQKLYSLLSMLRVNKKYHKNIFKLFNDTFENKCIFPEYFKTNDGIIYYQAE